MRKEEVFVLEYGGYAIVLLFAGGALQVFNFNDLGISILCASIFVWGTYVLYDSTSDVVSMFSHDDNDENNLSVKKQTKENLAGIVCDILKYFYLQESSLLEPFSSFYSKRYRTRQEKKNLN